MWKKSLKIKLVSTFIAISLVAIFVAVSSALTSLGLAAEKEVSNKLLLFAESQESQVFYFVESLKVRTMDFASDEFVIESVKKINASSSTTLVDSLSEHLVDDKKPLDPYIIGIDVVGLDGRVVASTYAGNIGRREPDLINHGNDNDAYFTSMYGRENFGSKDNFVVSAPLMDKSSDKVIGTIINFFDSKKLSEFLSGDSSYRSGAISSYLGREKTLGTYIIDSDGDVLVHAYSAGMEATEIKNIKNEIVDKCIERKEESSSRYINHFGKEVVGATMCLSKIENWTLLVEIDAIESFGSIDSASRGILVMLFFVLLFVSMIIVIIATKIIKPIIELKKASDIIAGGDLRHRVNIKTGDELEDLATSFNLMTHNLEKSQNDLREHSHDLEEKVAEKTKDLVDRIKEIDGVRKAILNVAEDAEEEKQKTIIEKDRVNAVLQGIGDGVFVVDNDLKIEIANNVATRISGYKNEEILGASYKDRFKFSSDDPEKDSHDFIDRAINAKASQELSKPIQFTRKDNSNIFVTGTAVPLLDRRGDVIGCVVAFRDTTREYEADKAKTEFVSLASHQLRTPLSIINWYSEMLTSEEYGKFNKKQKEFLEVIYNASKRMVSLVNALLNVSQLELGTIIVDLKIVDIVEVAKASLKDFNQQILEKRLTILERYEPEHFSMLSDARLLSIVFQNLISNAVKYTPAGGSVDISIVKEYDTILIKVSDTGIGIPSGQQSRIFGKLFRADNAKKTDPDGTGLGLYIVNKISNNLGGKAWFESGEGRGTVMYVSIPLPELDKNEAHAILNNS